MAIIEDSTSINSPTAVLVTTNSTGVTNLVLENNSFDLGSRITRRSSGD